MRRVILPVREPYDWDLVLDWLGTRAIPGLELVHDGVYRREGVEVARAEGGIAVTGAADPALVARVFDTAHDPAVLPDDPLFARAPGIRVPGAWTGWELAVRAVLGQQVSVAGARRTAEKLVAELGDGCRFPTPAAVLISADDLDSLEETLALLSDAEAMTQIRDSEQDIAAGDPGVTLADLRRESSNPQ